MSIKHLVAAAALGFASCSVQANLIVNGGFENPAISGWNVFGSIAGWNTSSGPGIEIQHGVAGASYEGAQHVELDSYGNTGMVQVVPTLSGVGYVLSFAYSPRPGVNAQSNPIELYINSVLIDTLTGAGGANTLWSLHDYAFTANGATSIEFRAVGTSDSLGGYLDDVRLTAAVPEPANLALLGGGLLMLGAARRRLHAKRQA